MCLRHSRGEITVTTYILKSDSSDKALFDDFCNRFEKEYADFKKLPPFADRANGALYLRFERGPKTAVFGIETLWQERIYVKANFDISKFVLKLNK